MIKKCLQCNKEFNSYPSAHRKFCSHKCFSLWNSSQNNYQSNKVVTKKCLQCNKYFTVPLCRQYTAKFCSKQCFYNFHPHQISKICKYCGKKYLTYSCKSNISKYCSMKCRSLDINPLKGLLGKNNPCWKGGLIKTSQGYVLIYHPNHPSNINGKYIRRSRLTTEQHLHRHLTEEEVIHHINSIKDDDNPNNLYIFSSNHDHAKYHSNPYQLKSNITTTI